MQGRGLIQGITATPCQAAGTAIFCVALHGVHSGSSRGDSCLVRVRWRWSLVGTPQAPEGPGVVLKAWGEACRV
eukprot:1137828-Pelagomonas_calceolata.AAC.4